VKPVVAFCQDGSDPNGLLGDTFADSAELPGVTRLFLASYLGELRRSIQLNRNAGQPGAAVDHLVIFLSSPKDCEIHHSDVREVVRWWNQRVPSRADAFLSLSIGKDAASEIRASGSPQEIINERLPIADADIVLGMMWHRCGTPTETAPSGTIEEIRSALARQEEAGLPWVCFYRCDAPVNPNDIDHQQHARVRDFVGELEMRGLVKPFRSGDHLQQVIKADLEDIVPRVLHLKNTKRATL
jgi:hypothetical protein